MKFEITYLCNNPECEMAFGLLGAFEPSESEEVLFPELGHIDDVVKQCPHCGSRNVLVEARQTGDDPMHWLIRQESTIQSTYLALRKNGLSHEDAEPTAAAVAHDGRNDSSC